MPNALPDPAGFIALAAGTPASIRALAEALCELGCVEKQALIASLERKISEWGGVVPDARVLHPLQDLIRGLREGGPPALH
jgi:hypothetical protein